MLSYNKIIKTLCTTAIIINLNACMQNQDGPPLFPVDVSHVKEPTPKHEPKSKYGNPATYTVFGKQYKTLKTSNDFSQKGVASWYGTKFHGRKTSSGEVYDMYAMTGAHKSLPLPTYARVTNLDNKKSIIIKINDRGPFHDDRIVDLSYAAAAKLGVLGKGTANVQLTAINPQTNTIKPRKLTNQELVNLQIGAFADKLNAEQLIKEVATIVDHPVTITTEHNKNQSTPQNLFRVHVKSIPIDQLTQIKNKLANLNINNPIVINGL